MRRNQIDLLVRSLDNLDGRDGEAAHSQAEALLLDFMPQEVRDAYERLVQRAPFWVTA